MPNVTKHTTNNLVTVSYPVREAHLTKSDLDFMKDFMSLFLAHGELMLKDIKEEADYFKESDKVLSDACYADLKKAKARMKKLAELQRKIKRMR